MLFALHMFSVSLQLKCSHTHSLSFLPIPIIDVINEQLNIRTIGARHSAVKSSIKADPGGCRLRLYVVCLVRHLKCPPSQPIMASGES